MLRGNKKLEGGERYRTPEAAGYQYKSWEDGEDDSNTHSREGGGKKKENQSTYLLQRGEKLVLAQTGRRGTKNSFLEKWWGIGKKKTRGRKGYRRRSGVGWGLGKFWGKCS